MRRIQFIMFLIGCLIFSLSDFSKAYEVETHRDITEKAVSISSIGINLQNNLGISLNDKFMLMSEIRNAKEWISLGSEKEDDGDSPRNHFLNPITNKGITDPVPLGKSALVWGTNDFDNDWSWFKAQSYYYNALKSSTETERNFLNDKFTDLTFINETRRDKEWISLGSEKYECAKESACNPVGENPT